MSVFVPVVNAMFSIYSEKAVEEPKGELRVGTLARASQSEDRLPEVAAFLVCCAAGSSSWLSACASIAVSIGREAAARIATYYRNIRVMLQIK
tara:strand:- start:7097 stop:7375 length:279 start_codon:yes stop_codon:yes gene_type:complete